MKNLVVLYAIIAGLAFLLVASWLRRTQQPLVDPATRALVDSLRRTHQQDSITIDLGQKREATLTRAADSAIARARAIETRATAVGARASATASAARSVDSSAKAGIAVARDSSARLWHAAYDQRTAEVDSLRRSIALREQADTNRTIARGIDTSAVVDLRARLARTEQANRGLQAAIDRAKKRGKLFGIIPEPTRTQTAIVTAVSAIAFDRLVLKR